MFAKWFLQPKNATCRDEIQKGITDGVNLPGLGHTILSKDLVDESCILYVSCKALSCIAKMSPVLIISLSSLDLICSI